MLARTRRVAIDAAESLGLVVDTAFTSIKKTVWLNRI